MKLCNIHLKNNFRELWHSSVSNCRLAETHKNLYDQIYDNTTFQIINIQINMLTHIYNHISHIS